MESATLKFPDPGSNLPHGERRRTVRQKLHTPVYVTFNGPHSGMVVDLSELLDLHENGFAVQTAIPSGTSGNDRLEVNRAVTLCLDLPETKKFVHGSGQVVWTDDSGRAGIRFSFLPDASRLILKEWLFANLLIASTNHAARVEQRARRQQEESAASELPPEESPSPNLPAYFRGEDERARPSATSLPVTMPEPTPASAPMPEATLMSAPAPAPNGMAAALSDRAELLSALDAVRRQIREIEAREIEARGIAAVDVPAVADADPILRLITERAMTLTGASGAALALLTDHRMLCRARAGDPAPPLGSQVDVAAGLSGACIRTGLLVTCEDAETDPRVDPEVCRMLGIGSFMAAPIFTDFRVAGLLEIFSPYPRSFTRIHEKILERLVELVPKIEKKRIEENRIAEKKAEKPSELVEDARPSLSPLESNLAPAIETQPEQSAQVERELQNVEDVPSPAIARRSHLARLLLPLLVLGTVALVLGYLLAPTIEKHWMSPATSPQASSRSSALGSQFTQQTIFRQNALNQGHAILPADLRKLADQGDAEAQYQLGILYHGGDVIPQDDAQAVQWFERAAEQGYAPAQSTLGAYYWAGRGVPEDLTKAYFWSQLALAQGDEISKSRLEGLSAQMTQAQVANARQQAEDWLRFHTQATKRNPGAK